MKRKKNPYYYLITMLVLLLFALMCLPAFVAISRAEPDAKSGVIVMEMILIKALTLDKTQFPNVNEVKLLEPVDIIPPPEQEILELNDRHSKDKAVEAETERITNGK